MKKEDARKLSSQVQEEKRKQAIRLQKKGLKYKEIAELVGVHFETIGKWVRAYKANGTKGIEIQEKSEVAAHLQLFRKRRSSALLLIKHQAN